MSKLNGLFVSKVQTLAEIESGLYTSHHLKHNDQPFRLHLRVEPNHEGVLTLNASTVLHLNKTAMEMAYFLIQGQNPKEIAKTMHKRYKAHKNILLQDVNRFYDTLTSFLDNTDLAPTGSFGLIELPEDTQILAPYRLNCYLSSENAGEKLSLPDWKIILEKAYNAGIPHLIFLDPDPSDDGLLIDLLLHAEKLGLVTGLVAEPATLKDFGYLHKLIMSGLDHLVLDADPQNQDHMQILIHIINQDLFTCLRISIQENFDYIPIIEDLIAKGINAFSFFETQNEFNSCFQKLTEMISDKGIAIIDDMPYSLKYFPLKNRTTKKDLDQKYLTLMPDGELFIPSENPISIGNLLEENWNELWAKCRTISNG